MLVKFVSRTRFFITLGTPSQLAALRQEEGTCEEGGHLRKMLEAAKNLMPQKLRVYPCIVDAQCARVMLVTWHDHLTRDC